MEIKSLTGLRGIAALIVLWFHIKAALVSRGLELDFPLLIDRILFSGGNSVDIFFVLSGFILAITYKEWFVERIEVGAYLKYFRRRFARIYPLHFVLLVATALAVAAAHSLNIKTNLGLERFDPATLPAHFLLMQAWGIFFSNSGTWNPPSWSISIELLAYFLMPFILLGMSRFRSSQSSIALLVAIVILGFVLNAITPWGDWGFAGIARGVSEFILGCVTARFIQSDAARWLQTNMGSWLAAFAMLAVSASIPDTGFIIGVCASLLILSLCGNSPVSRFMACKPVYFLGEISYSLYVGHFLYTLVAWRIINPDWMATGWLPLLGGFLATNALVIALSTVTYYLIECPGRNLFSDKKRSKSAAITQPTR